MITKINLTIVAILLTCSVFSQTLLMKNDVKIQRFGKDIFYKTNNNNLLDGHYKIADSKGNYSDIHFKKGKKHGVAIKYDYEGRKLVQYNFENGKQNGTYTSFYQNGKVWIKGAFINGNKNGKWEYFDKNGTLKAFENYKNGKKDGKWWKKIFYSNTYYTKDEYYQDDIPTGVWRDRWQNGYLKEERTYKGKGTYVAKTFHKNGKLYEQKSYKDFKLDGIQLVYLPTEVLVKKELYCNSVLEKRETFFDNGQAGTIYNLKNGKLHGKFIDYRRSGAKYEEGVYRNGYKIGVWKLYRGEDGWLYSETTYEDGTKNGQHKVYYKSGIVEKEGNNIKGSRNGIWKFYNEAGKLIKETEYKLGRKISSKEYKQIIN